MTLEIVRAVAHRDLFSDFDGPESRDNKRVRVGDSLQLEGDEYT